MILFIACESGIYYMISTGGHTAVANKTSMSERQSLWGLGSKAKQIVEIVFNYFHRESAADTTSANKAGSTTYRCWPRYSLQNLQ